MNQQSESAQPSHHLVSAPQVTIPARVEHSGLPLSSSFATVVSMDSRSGSTHSREPQAASNNTIQNNSTTQDFSRSSSSKSIAGYAIRGRLGSGSFASVFRGVRDPTIASAPEHTYPSQEVVAIKAISRSEKLSKKVLENLEIEISILRNYRHPNIVEMYHVEKTRGHYYLILEFCAGGDLQRLIRSRKSGRLSEKLTRRLFRDLASGLRFLYERQLIHRDIKPQNLLLSGFLPLDELEDEAKDANDEEKRRRENYPTKWFSLKIADFGFARHLQSTSLAETLCGSPLYMAPEILQHQRYDAKADLWSAGAVLFEMIAGRPPFHGENHIDLLRNIQRRAVRLPPGVKVTPECVNILRLLLNRNPLSRAGFQQFFDATNAFVALGCNGPDPPLCSENACDGGMQTNGQTLYASMGLDKIAEEETRENVDLAQSSSPPSNKEEVTRLARVSVTSGSDAQLARHNSTQVPSHFSPLVPSPPGPRGIQGASIPPSFSLDGGPITIPVGSMPNVIEPPANDKRSYAVAKTTTLRQTTTHHSPFVPQGALSGSSSQSDGDEFVMVEHQLQASMALNRSRNAALPRRAASEGRAMQTTSPAKGRPNAPPTAYQRFRGLLSTSPGTGGKLMGAMMQQQRHQPRECSSSVHSQSPDTSRGRLEESLHHHDPNNLDTAIKMLAVSEDVGRRAVHVAHLGDTRAYLAMRSLMTASMSSTSCESATMEGVEDSGSTGSKCTSVTKFSKSSKHKPVEAEDGDNDDDDEMPFAFSPTEYTESPKQQPNSATSVNSEKDRQVATAHAHFREALSCYMKALPLMKGAVTATQRVLEAMKAGHNVDGSPVMDQKGCALLANRSHLSLQWLSSQFTGVVERADAAADEIKKYGLHLQAEKVKELPVVFVEELVYNHSLACGKDGAVKQLLGQYDVARVSYRSAALLAETLLMERRLSANDRQVLESYVNGFADRIKEVDRCAAHQGTAAATPDRSPTEAGDVASMVGEGDLPQAPSFGNRPLRKLT